MLPDIGRLAPESARTAIREVFLEHVIGGDRLSTDPRLRQWVRAVTPDAVLEGVSVLAGLTAAGETCRASSSWTSAAPPPTSTACPTRTPSRRPSVARRSACPARRRTVEGDLGVSGASRRPADGGRAPRDCPCPATTRSSLGEAAATVALRRHLRAEAAYGPGGASARAASASSSSPAACSGTPTPRPSTPSSPGWPPTAVARAASLTGTPGRRRPPLRARRGRTAGRRAPGRRAGAGPGTARRRGHVSGRVTIENSAAHRPDAAAANPATSSAAMSSAA